MAQPRGREATRPRGRPCGAPRVSSVMEGTVTTLIGKSTPLFNRAVSHHFFRVGLCPTRLTFLQVMWTRGRRRISSRWRRSRGPESTRSSIKHVVICTLSDPLDGRHVAERGSMDLHRTAATFRDRGHYTIIRFSSNGHDRSRSWRRAEPSGASDLHHADGSESRGPRGSCRSRSPGSPSDGPRSSRPPPIVATRGPLQSAGFPSDDGGQSWKNSTITVRSSRDRGAYVAESPPFERTTIDERSGP